MTKEDLIEKSLKNNFALSWECDARVLKYASNPKLEDGHVFIEINQQGMVVLAHSPKVDQARLQVVTAFIGEVIKKFNLNLNFRFILNTYDEPATGDFPVFSFCGNPKYPCNIVIPDPHLLSRYMGKTYADNKEFKYKKEGMVFRGSDTGSFPCATKNERIAACNKTYSNPRYNFKISNFVSYSKDGLDLFGVDIDKISGPYLSNADQAQFQYIVDINGNTAAWDRPCWALGLNSILIKVQLNKDSDETWYSRYMETEDIVPRFNLSELDTVNLDPSVYNPKQQQFAKILLNRETQEEYLKNILIRYESQYNQ